MGKVKETLMGEVVDFTKWEVALVNIRTRDRKVLFATPDQDAALQFARVFGAARHDSDREEPDENVLTIKKVR